MVDAHGGLIGSIALCAATAFVLPTTLATTHAAEPPVLLRAPDADSIVRYRGPVAAADTVGGHRSDAILVKLAPRAALRLAGGTPELRCATGTRATEMNTLLRDAGASKVARAFAVLPTNAAVEATVGLARWHRIELPAGTDTPALVDALRTASRALAAPAVERIELEGLGGVLGAGTVMPNDASFSLQYGLHNTGQTIQGIAGVADSDLDLPEAWSLHTGGADVTIAIIDTGVSASHPDLNDKLVAGRNTINDNSSTDDSWLISHGTHCAGIAAAESNNGVGIAGVSWGARIMPVKVLTTLGSGTEGDVAEGIAWAADNGADVLSMSLGFPGLSAIIEDAVEYAAAAGKVIVAASGNTAGAPIGAPAVYAPVIAVGATDNRDLIASFTTTGPELDVVAPGVDVYSTYDTLFQANSYTWQSGTSMACPHVAGLAALIWSANPELDAAGVRSILESTADDRGATGWDPTFGHGRVNALKAVEAALASRCVAGDLDCDGAVDAEDLTALLAAWGTADPSADIEPDGVVDGSDLAVLLGNWS
ncbi:MAG: S8 family serine peptidase [Phycisphaera sp.]|nr:S8 family serine peptidase [Phycisphaera sp.]